MTTFRDYKDMSFKQYSLRIYYNVDIKNNDSILEVFKCKYNLSSVYTHDDYNR